MKNFLQIMGVLTLFVVSFSYHGEVAKVVKLSDNLLEQIKENKDLYKSKKIEAVVTKNTIIPGINGKEVDINKSYNAMKQNGKFDEQKLVYKKDIVEDELIDNKNKYIISGNKSKKQVTLVFNVKANDNTNKIVDILSKNSVQGTFFITSEFAKDNIEKVKKMISNMNTVGNLSENDDYIWLKTLITSSGFQKNNYCIADSLKRINFCQKYNDYTIKVDNVISEMPLIDVKKQLKNGAFLYFNISNKLIEELPNIINYIVGRGYEIVSLEELLQE